MTTKESPQTINNWKKENILNLASHFHQFNGEQHERVKAFLMGDNDRSTLSNKIAAGSIKEMKIHLALMDSSTLENPSTFIAYFIMELKDLENNTIWLDLVPTANDPCAAEPDSDLVPKIFKEMIVKNWNELDQHLIDDLFLAEKEGQILRAHHFKICQDMVDFINQSLLQNGETLEAVTVYPGVDMNKFVDKTSVSFTPVLGFRMDTAVNSKIPFGIKGCGGREVLIEYSLPCPPTCESMKV